MQSTQSRTLASSQLNEREIWIKELQELDAPYQYLVKGLILGLQHTGLDIKAKEKPPAGGEKGERT